MAGWLAACVVVLVAIWLLVVGQPESTEQLRQETVALKTQVTRLQALVPTPSPTPGPHYCSPYYYMYCGAP